MKCSSSVPEFVRLHDISLKGKLPERNCGIGCGILAVTGMGDEMFVGNFWTSFGAMAASAIFALGAHHYEKRYQRVQQQLPILQATAMAEVIVAFEAPSAHDTGSLGHWIHEGEEPTED